MAVDGGEAAPGLGDQDRAGGDVVGRLAEEGAGDQPAAGHEGLFAAGAPQVAEPPGEGPGVDGPERVGPDADVILAVEPLGVARLDRLAVAPGPTSLRGPEQLIQGRDGDDALQPALVDLALVIDQINSIVERRTEEAVHG